MKKRNLLNRKTAYRVIKMFISFKNLYIYNIYDSSGLNSILIEYANKYKKYFLESIDVFFNLKILGIMQW